MLSHNAIVTEMKIDKLLNLDANKVRHYQDQRNEWSRVQFRDKVCMDFKLI